MDYLTNYYRNLCEQLQEKLNILEGQLNELNYGPGGIKVKLSNRNWTKDALSGGGADNSKRIPTTFVKPSYIPRHDQPYVDQNKQPLKRRQLNPGYEYGLDGEPVYVGDTEPIKPFGGFKPEDLYVGGKSNLSPTSQTSAESEGETDEDIYAMRQTAVDQGGLPQRTVNEPINRTKQMPDGTLIHTQTPTRLQMKPKPGLQVKPKMPLPAPEEKETMIPMSLKGLRDEISFNKKQYGLIPPTRKDLMS